MALFQWRFSWSIDEELRMWLTVLVQLNSNIEIFITENKFEIVIWKMTSILSHPWGVKLVKETLTYKNSMQFI